MQISFQFKDAFCQLSLKIGISKYYTSSIIMSSAPCMVFISAGNLNLKFGI